MFHDDFDYDDKRTAKADLGALLHHYDDVDPVIRVGQYDDSTQAFPLSLVPPPSDDEKETIINYLDGHGFNAEVIQGILHITSQHDE